ncbi:MAG: phosphopantetheine-binding protein [Humidesulfovibrio sp.]|uniref:acyl carrier protein n=1 Tax=Humidesulfovibrio sp. TaxID=2910988 RepID=UPI0027357388|nr:phosphopantetheine-binding protein [Humidesulfovibrio sp.]MDP2849240.1 phosphopantetheine-binding protein [Humidesulfovibrio sp.]
MTREEKVKQLIIKVGEGKITEDMITLDADLNKDLGLDSLAMVELLVMTEDAFGIQASKDDAQAAGTLRLTLAYLDKYLEA